MSKIKTFNMRVINVFDTFFVNIKNANPILMNVHFTLMNILQNTSYSCEK